MEVGGVRVRVSLSRPVQTTTLLGLITTNSNQNSIHYALILFPFFCITVDTFTANFFQALSFREIYEIGSNGYANLTRI